MHRLAKWFAGWYGINVGTVCCFPYDFFLVKEEVEEGGDLVSGFEKQFGTLLFYLLITCFNHLSEVRKILHFQLRAFFRQRIVGQVDKQLVVVIVASPIEHQINAIQLFILYAAFLQELSP